MTRDEQFEAMPEPPYKGILIMMCGLPRSGKTTWALQKGYPIVCPDAIRLALHGQRFVPDAEPIVWAIAEYMVKALFLAHHRTVILDATNGTQKRRDRWANPMWDRLFVVVDTPPDVCLQRAEVENDAEIAPIIADMSIKWEPPTTEELKEWESLRAPINVNRWAEVNPLDNRGVRT